MKIKTGILLSAILSLFLLASNAFANEDKVTGICLIASGYGKMAFAEKEGNKDFNINDSYELFVSNLTKSQDFNKLEYSEQEIFVKLIWDIYQFVYESKDLTYENIGNKTMSHCIEKSKLAFSRINERAKFCHGKGRLYEMVADHRAKGSSKIFVTSMYNDLLRDNEKARVDLLSIVESIYSDENFLSPGRTGRIAYRECLIN